MRKAAPSTELPNGLDSTAMPVTQQSGRDGVATAIGVEGLQISRWALAAGAWEAGTFM
jgi:hypothetical protein